MGDVGLTDFPRNENETLDRQVVATLLKKTTSDNSQ
jgi:hypothetical protein